MTLRDLVNKMYSEEKLMIKYTPNDFWLECTPDKIINDYDAIRDLPVSVVWYSQLYGAIMIELE